MKIKLKRTEIQILAMAIRALMQMAAGKTYKQKFNHAIGKTEKLLESEMKGIVNGEKSLTDYNKERMDIIRKFAETDKAGKLVVFGNSYKIPERMTVRCNKEIDELKVKYKDILDENKKFMEEVVEMDIYKVLLENVPDLDPNIHKLLIPMIEEEKLGGK